MLSFKKSKLIYFEFSSHCLVWLASRLEPSLIFWLAKIASRAELGSFTCGAEPSRASSARLLSSPSGGGGAQGPGTGRRRRPTGEGRRKWGSLRPPDFGGWRRPAYYKNIRILGWLQPLPLSSKHHKKGLAPFGLDSTTQPNRRHEFLNRGSAMPVLFRRGAAG